MDTLVSTLEELVKTALCREGKSDSNEQDDQALMNKCVSLSGSFKAALMNDVEFKEESMHGEYFLEMLRVFIETFSYIIEGTPEDKLVFSITIREILCSLTRYMVQKVKHLNASILDIEKKYISEQKLSKSAFSKLTTCRMENEELKSKLDAYSNNPEEVKRSQEASGEIRTVDSPIDSLQSSLSDENSMIKSSGLNLKMATKLVQTARESRVDRTRSIQQHQSDESEKINQLAKRMEEMSQQLAQYTARSDRSEAENREIKAKNREINAKNQELAKVIDEVTNQLAQNTARCDLYEAEKQEIKARCDLYEAENREIKAKNQELAKVIDEVTNQLAQNTARCDLYEAENKEIKAENKKMKVWRKNFKAQNKQIKERFNQISEENKKLKDIEERFNQIVADNKELKAKFDELKEERKEMPEKKNENTAKFSRKLSNINLDLPRLINFNARVVFRQLIMDLRLKAVNVCFRKGPDNKDFKSWQDFIQSAEAQNDQQAMVDKVYSFISSQGINWKKCLELLDDYNTVVHEHSPEQIDAVLCTTYVKKRVRRLMRKVLLLLKKLSPEDTTTEEHKDNAV